MDFKKILNTILIIFFPLGILFCVGKALFGSSFSSFLGCIFICAIGFVLAIYLFRYDLIEPVIVFFSNLFVK